MTIRSLSYPASVAPFLLELREELHDDFPPLPPCPRGGFVTTRPDL